MHITTLGNTLIGVGIAIFMASAVADALGFGGSAGFGPGQIVGLIFGPVICFVGFNVKGQID